MILLPEVDAEGVDPRLVAWLHVLDLDHRQRTGLDLVVTSLRRPRGARASRHSPAAGELVGAADIRRWHLDQTGVMEAWARTLQRYFGRWLGVVVEPEWLSESEVLERGGISAIEGHVHVQLKGGAWPESR